MSWWVVILLTVGAYTFKVLGLVIVGDRALPPTMERCLGLIPAALIGALVVKDTFSTGQHLGIDARAVGVAGAVIACWRRFPLMLVVIIGAGLTAGVRLAMRA